MTKKDDNACFYPNNYNILKAISMVKKFYLNGIFSLMNIQKKHSNVSKKLLNEWKFLRFPHSGPTTN